MSGVPPGTGVIRRGREHGFGGTFDLGALGLDIETVRAQLPSRDTRSRQVDGVWYIAVHLRTLGSVSFTVTISEARASLPAIVERVIAGEEVTLTRHGQPVAVVVRPDTLRTRRAGSALAAAASVNDALERGRTSRLSLRPTLSEERADALVADVRAARSGR